MSLYRALGFVQWALALVFLAACAWFVVCVIRLIEVATK